MAAIAATALQTGQAATGPFMALRIGRFEYSGHPSWIEVKRQDCTRQFGEPEGDGPRKSASFRFFSCILGQGTREDAGRALDLRAVRLDFPTPGCLRYSLRSLCRVWASRKGKGCVVVQFCKGWVAGRVGAGGQATRSSPGQCQLCQPGCHPWARRRSLRLWMSPERSGCARQFGEPEGDGPRTSLFVRSSRRKWAGQIPPKTAVRPRAWRPVVRARVQAARSSASVERTTKLAPVRPSPQNG